MMCFGVDVTELDHSVIELALVFRLNKSFIIIFVVIVIG